jgi:predicted flap endonuclease-1-like 5' DNA nuclease
VVISIAIVLIALAALAGYFIGSRQRRTDSNGPAPDVVRGASVAEPVTRGSAVGQPTRGANDNPGDEDRVGAEKARLIRSRDGEAAQLRRELGANEAARAQLEEFARDRERLFGELADAKNDAARYRQLIVDIENNAPPPILSGTAGPDDLKLIVGVGPVLERMLHTLGVTTFRQIGRWTEHDIAEFDAKLPEFPGRIVRDQWVIQARALHKSKYGEALDTTRSHG